jgi:hypothetical protein
VLFRSNIDDLEVGKDYAVVVDFTSEEGSPVPESRQALKFRKFRETDKFALASTNYSIPLGNFKDDAPSQLLEKVGEYSLNVLKGAGAAAALYAAVSVAGQAYMVWSLYKGSRNIYKNWGTIQRANQALGRANLWGKMKNFASTAFKGKGTSSIINAARINLPSGSSIVGNQAFGRSGQLLNLPQTKFVARGAVKRGLISRAASRKLIQAAATRAAGTAAGSAATGGAVAASNPIGWIVAAAYAAAGAIQQTVNWVSSKQAPRYSEVKSFAYGKFSPGKIPTGKPITICWTEDGGAGTWGGIAKMLTLSKDDTRTTMDLVKLGNFQGESVFMLTKVNSKSMENILKNNEIVLVKFNNSDEFARGTLDNDDLVFETIAIEDTSELAIATYFIGYDEWENMVQEYNAAPDTPFFVPDQAPEKYPFNYTEGDRKYNVQGNLMNDSELKGINVGELIPIPGQSAGVSESFILESSLSEESKPFAVNFENFVTYISEEDGEKIKFGPIGGGDPVVATKEEKPKEEASKEEKEDDKLSNWEKKFAEINQGKKVDFNNPYQQVPLVIYEVEDIEFVNPEEKGDLPQFKYFIVALESLDAKDGDPIGVEVTSDDPVNEPTKGLAKFTPEKREEEPEEPGKPEESPDEDKTKTTTHKDVVIKTSATKTTIRDKEVEGGINIYDEFLTDEDKKKLALPKWKNITFAEIRRNKNGEPEVVVLRNKFAKLGDRIRKIRKGQSGFDNAVEFVERVESKVKYV